MNDNTRTDKSGTPISAEDIAEVDGVSAPALRVVNDADVRLRTIAREEARAVLDAWEAEHGPVYRRTPVTPDDFMSYDVDTPMDWRTYLAQPVEEQMTPRMTHADVAHELAVVMRTVLRYDETAEEWLTWTGSHWESGHKAPHQDAVSMLTYAGRDREPRVLPWSVPTTGTARKRTISEAIDRGQAYEWEGDVYDTITDAPYVPIAPSPLVHGADLNHVYRGVLAHGMKVTADDLDTHDNLLHMASGVIDLDTITAEDCTPEVLPADPAYLNTRVIGADLADYDPDDPDAGVWTQVIESYFPDPDVRRHVQIRAGQMLDPRVTKKWLMWWHGTVGDNGKSTLAGHLNSVFGDYGCDVPSSVIQGDPDTHPADVATLRGARCAIASETEDHLPYRVALLKRLTGGHDAIQARGMGENYDKAMHQTWGLIIASNNDISASGAESALWNRIEKVPFTRSFVPNPDPRDPSQVQADDALIARLDTPVARAETLLWLLAGLHMAHAEGSGYTPPDVIRTASEEARAGSSPEAGFANAVFEIREGSPFVPNEVLPRLLTEFLYEAGFPVPKSPPTPTAVKKIVQGSIPRASHVTGPQAQAMGLGDVPGFTNLSLTPQGEDLARKLHTSWSNGVGGASRRAKSYIAGVLGK